MVYGARRSRYASRGASIVSMLSSVRARRMTAALLAHLALGLLVVGSASARAGGGSGGFGHGFGGGGGGGGFGGRGGGGHGGGLFVLFFIFTHPLLLALIVIAIAVVLVVSWVRSAAYRARLRARRRARGRRVELAAAEAAEDDEAFAVNTVREQAAALFRETQVAWDARDRTTLSGIVGPDLMVEWKRRLDDFDRRHWHNRVRILEGPQVEYVGLTNRAEDRDDRIVIRIEAVLEDYVEDRIGRRIQRDDAGTTRRFVAEYWTLGKREGDGRWIVLSIEQGAEGDHQLEETIVPTPWGDTGRLRDASLVELAAADKLPDDVKASELASVEYEGNARAAALDLSLADGRFAPDVLEVAVRRAVAAWAEAVDGSDRDLAAVATPEALHELLHPGDAGARTRLVVRGPRVHKVSILGLDAASDPPRMTVTVEAEGRRYIEDRDTTTIVSGSQSRPTRFSERWTLALAGDDENPWRIVDARGGGVPATRA